MASCLFGACRSTRESAQSPQAPLLPRYGGLEAPRGCGSYQEAGKFRPALSFSATLGRVGPGRWAGGELRAAASSPLVGRRVARGAFAVAARPAPARHGSGPAACLVDVVNPALDDSPVIQVLEAGRARLVGPALHAARPIARARKVAIRTGRGTSGRPRGLVIRSVGRCPRN
jgi:hypothetical protein